ncbi:hypothetical protein A8B84_20545 [Marinobacter sp. EhC06]|uniref:hypothetical protein n=1 Tax=Marinobacter TaxID=2742 RepID=UPI0007DA1F83|nr:MULTISPECIES: hypothetical protein [unclassified Marinobacter]OAN92955.1 hypothetical protein A8B84_20545 [Marinobacter sp. EhC06]OAN93106.1 hypothetical protein A8B80_17860 [Marinobacter sp. EhN04]
MPLQNRVSPLGTIESSPARGTLMGNRGVLHNSKKEVQHLFRNKGWITCLLEFKGRQRELMSAGFYTELFFLDEVTAFAAGHRPCAECRRKRYNEFRDVWSRVNDPRIEKPVRAPQMDGVLHEEGLHGDQKVTWRSPISDLPHETMFSFDGVSYAICNQRVLRWAFGGYSVVEPEKLPDTVDVLTPKSVVRIVESGFRPQFHSSADSSD